MVDSLKFFNALHVFRTNAVLAIKSGYSFWHIRIYLISAVLVNVLIWFLGRRIKNASGGEQISLHYTVDFGIDYYGSANQVFIIPVLGLIIIIFNITLVLILNQNKDFVLLSHLLLAAAVLANIVLLAAITSVYLINFR